MARTRFACEGTIKTHKGATERLHLADGQAKGSIAHFSRLTVWAGIHCEVIDLLIHDLAEDNPVILGHPWLVHHAPGIDWPRDSLYFGPACEQRGYFPRGAPNHLRHAPLARRHVIIVPASLIVEHVQEWLAKDDNVDWLLIFDNVDLDHTQGEIPGAYDIRKYLRSDHGAVLITSQLSKLAQLGESKRIKPADVDLSKKIFEKWYGKELMMDDDAQELLDKKLGGLPLALAQAAAYMRELDLPVAKYIHLYEKQWDEPFPNTDSGLLDYSTRSVWTTWTISFNAIETRDKNAGNLLRLWAFLDNREMWHSLLQVARNDQEQWPEWLRDIAGKEVKFFNIATLLLRYSMIEVRESEQSSYSMHPVVHRWISHIQDDAGKREFLRLAVILIGFSVPHRTTKNYWVLQRRLLPHTERFLWWMGKLEGGECNNEDITIGHATHSLGHLYETQGRLKEAETMYQRALEGKEKTLGPDHTSTLSTVNNLGNLYSDQGRLKEAETMYQRALEGKEKALGPDHTSTLGTVYNLGLLYSDQGRLKEAEVMYQRALSGYSVVSRT
ncbi:hypothetical protein B0H65DRAFT_436208 [Neurospora tetraspora]|uniref:DUF7779 domain-containing protein n=1 Tax=Neurospora tetraspora TaxID=94610 RepID=A0AAE0J266_9PEZI|nr:hypothetical protein B0H65DRAFT_436208 [Neurospora tetraspora]